MSAPINVDQIMEQVSKETGLSDFGDPAFRDGLDVLVASIRDEARLSEIGDAVAAGQIRRSLATRLLVEDWVAQHPEVEKEQIEAPIFTIGISRSGTTALNHLLARDPANRSLLGWEAADPVPPPQPDTYWTDPRFEAAKANEMGLLQQLNPELMKMHHDPPDMPVECLVPFTPAFVTLSLSLLFSIPTYTRWVRDTDHTAAYRWHSQTLRLLQSGGVRGRWQLKSPQHAIVLDTVIAHYPDARFIVTHRDPATCVASVANMGRAFSDTFSEPREGAEFGTLWTDVLFAMADGAIDFRRKHGDDRFIDVSYRDLTQYPVETVQRIYDALGEPLSAEAERAMRDHTSVAVQNRFGKHEYSWDSLGLTREALDERFSDYRARYAEFLV
jgi:hypothetical protein